MEKIGFHCFLKLFDWDVEIWRGFRRFDAGTLVLTQK